jgi:hypothetical protein
MKLLKVDCLEVMKIIVGNDLYMSSGGNKG